MFPTRAVLAKAYRGPLTSKRGPKDYYKGNRQAYLPGGPRTGPPGKHVIRGKAKYRIVDEMARVFVAPPIEKIVNSPLKPYVARDVRLTDEELRKSDKETNSTPQFWNMGMGPGGLTPDRYLNVLRTYNKYSMTYDDYIKGQRRAKRARKTGRIEKAAVAAKEARAAVRAEAAPTTLSA